MQMRTKTSWLNDLMLGLTIIPCSVEGRIISDPPSRVSFLKHILIINNVDCSVSVVHGRISSRCIFTFGRELDDSVWTQSHRRYREWCSNQSNDTFVVISSATLKSVFLSYVLFHSVVLVDETRCAFCNEFPLSHPFSLFP